MSCLERLGVVRERIDADNPVALAPGVSPAVQPLADTSRKTQAGSTAAWVLRSGVFFFADNDVSCENLC